MSRLFGPARAALALVALVASALVGCSKSPKGAYADGGAPADEKGSAAAQKTSAPDDDELLRWARRDGVEALMEAARTGERKRPEVYRALAQAGELRVLAFLADEAKTREKDARAALEAANEVAATPRRQGDPDDVEELHTACETLLWLAKQSSRPPKERALAISTLRMLVPYGCVRAAEIPTDLDAK